LTVALFVEGLLGVQHAVGKATGVAGNSDARLDRARAAGAWFMVAVDEGLALLRQSEAMPMSASRFG
jgi:hypothetical protein